MVTLSFRTGRHHPQRSGNRDRAKMAWSTTGQIPLSTVASQST